MKKKLFFVRLLLIIILLVIVGILFSIFSFSNRLLSITGLTPFWFSLVFTIPIIILLLVFSILCTKNWELSDPFVHKKNLNMDIPRIQLSKKTIQKINSNIRFNSFVHNTLSLNGLLVLLVFTVSVYYLFFFMKPVETQIKYITREVTIENSILPPINTSGDQVAVIHTNYEMKHFMTEIYGANTEFFSKRIEKIFLTEHDTLSYFDGNFEEIAYNSSETSSHVIKLISSLDYETIWLFISDLDDIEPNPSDTISEKNIIIYSPKIIDSEKINILKTYFKNVNFIGIETLKGGI